MKRLLPIAGMVATIATFSAVASTYTITTTAANTYENPLAIDDATVSVDVGSGAVDMSFEDAKATFSAGAVFRKRGPGYLKGSPSMFTFTGQVRIEEGGYMAVTNRCLGPTASDSANAVVVSNGASLVFYTTAATCSSDTFYVNNAITFEGSGYESRGALSFDLGTVCMKNAGFRGNWSLSGDAEIGIYKAQYINALAGYLYFNNHVLTYKQKGSGVGIYSPKRFIAGGTNARLVVDGSLLEYRMQDISYWSGSAANELVFTNGANILWYIFDQACPWSFVVNDGARLGISGKGTYPGDLGSSSSGIVTGNLMINEDVFKISGAAARQGAWCKGYVSGKGGLFALDTWLKLSCPTNSFDGSVAVGVGSHDSYGRGLALYANGAIPVTCAGVAVTNATTYLGKEEIFSLPKTDYMVDSGVHSISGLATRVEFASLRKTGAGTLDVSTIPLSASGRLEVLGGTLKLNGGAVAEEDASQLYSAVPGLWCGISPNTVGSGSSDSIVYSNFVDSAFTMLGQRTYPPWTQNRPTVWGGYIWNRSPTNETWTFAISVYSQGRVYIDGSALVNNDDYGAVSMANKVMTPGAHKFRMAVNPRTYSSPGHKSVNNATYTWGNNMGIAIDRFGRMSKNSADYFFPTNAVVSGTSGFVVAGGDGSLFTRDDRERSEFTDAELKGVLRATSVSDLALSSSATLDLGGSAADVPVQVSDFAGGGTVANGSLVINGEWTLEVAGIAPVALNVTGGSLSFGPSSALAFDGSAFRTGASGRVIATASEGISGLPSLPAELVEAGWRVELSADSHSLVVIRQAGLMIVVE